MDNTVKNNNKQSKQQQTKKHSSTTTNNQQQQQTTTTNNNQFDTLIKRLQQTSFNQNNHRTNKHHQNIQKNSSRNLINSPFIVDLNQSIHPQSNNQPHHPTNCIPLPSSDSSLSPSLSSHYTPSHRLDWASLVDAASKSDAEEDQLPDLTEWEKDSKQTQQSSILTIQLPSIPKSKSEHEPTLLNRDNKTPSLVVQSRAEILHSKLSPNPIQVQLGTFKPPSINQSLKNDASSIQITLPSSALEKQDGQLSTRNLSSTTKPSRKLPGEITACSKQTSKSSLSTLFDSIHRPTSPKVTTGTTPSTTAGSSRNNCSSKNNKKQSVAHLIIRPHAPLSPPSTSSSSRTEMTTTEEMSLSSSTRLMPSSSSNSGSSSRADDDTTLTQKSSTRQVGFNTLLDQQHLTIPRPSHSGNLTSSPVPTVPTPLTDVTFDSLPSQPSDLVTTQSSCSTVNPNQSDPPQKLQPRQNKKRSVGKIKQNDKREKKTDSTPTHIKMNDQEVSTARKESDVEKGTNNSSEKPSSESQLIPTAEITQQLKKNSSDKDPRPEKLITGVKKNDKKKKRTTGKNLETHPALMQEKRSVERSSHPTGHVDSSLLSNSSDLIPPNTPSVGMGRNGRAVRKNNSHSSKAAAHLFDKLTGGALLHPPPNTLL